MKRISILCVLGWLFCTPLHAQRLDGRVTDTRGNPIQDAYVLANRDGKHAHTNEAGYFLLDGLQPGDTLTVGYLGFQSERLALQPQHFQTLLHITLEEKLFDLGQVVISNRLRTVSQIANVDLQSMPVNSSQEILRRVPGLFIGQHAGGGKAEQLFLRGFDLDHGTDLALTVDGLPVNMVSHAHGQGYSDLHFLIPETVEQLDFGKGPYYPEHGNFATAGFVDFQTRKRLEESTLRLEAGRFNTLRTLALLDLLPESERQSGYLAAEYLLGDGPFESPQNFNRLNLMGKFGTQLPQNGRLDLTAFHFQSRWDASGQIPERAVRSGLISRFGAIDDTEGGSTSRTSLLLHHTRTLSPKAFVKSFAYFSHYRFELFSNFTFFRDDPENGDQIRQRERRNLLGFQSVLHRRSTLGNNTLDLQIGTGLRFDAVRDLELAHTLNRRTLLESRALGEVDESNLYAFVQAELVWGKVVLIPGLRLDYLKFQYGDGLSPRYRTHATDRLFAAPKFNLLFNPSSNWQFYFKSGVGFHSNDSRVAAVRAEEKTLPAALGADVGALWKPRSRLWLNLAGWYLFLEQEFVYVGDEAVVEPSGRSRRLGLDFGLRYQIGNDLYLDGDLTYAHARSLDEPEGADFIPLAPQWTAAGGLAWKSPGGLAAGARFRYLADRPADETARLTARGYFLVDAHLEWSFESLTLGLTVENLFDAEWKEAQFATESRLPGEAESVEEIHFTPGTPFFLKGNFSFRF